MEVKALTAHDEWAFNGLKHNETRYISHGYHKYPAKFIPQLVHKIIDNYSKEGDVILDPFGGCGTTLIESKIYGRESIGIDVNDIAVLITKAKTTPINPELLIKKNDELKKDVSSLKTIKETFRNAHPRLKYWFHEDEYNKLQELYKIIKKEKNDDIKNFYLVCFSNILKNCSIWYAKSIKPMRDLNKVIEDPFKVFFRHLNYMVIKNRDFYNLVKEKKVKNVSTMMLKGDARKTELNDKSVDLIITSPPYVTSYEYADLHQISTLWFKYTDDIKKIKKHFIGTTTRQRVENEINSVTANIVLNKISKKSKRYWRNISKYYFDLSKAYAEMYRVLRPDSYACLIIGDTEYFDISISNTNVSIELLKNSGFELVKVIKRKLSSKYFTPYRDKNGRFTRSTSSDKRKIYQYEYIIIAKKL